MQILTNRQKKVTILTVKNMHTDYCNFASQLGSLLVIVLSEKIQMHF